MTTFTTLVMAYVIIGLVMLMFHLWLFLNDEYLYNKYYKILVTERKWMLYSLVIIFLWPLIVGFFIYYSLKSDLDNRR